MSLCAPQAIRLDPHTLGLPDVIDQAIGVQLHLRFRFRRILTREVLLIHGPKGWGEFCPFPEYGPPATHFWLASALEAAVTGWPAPTRTIVPVNATVPAVSPPEATAIVRQTHATTVKVKVADPGQVIDDDVARIRAVRQALGDAGQIRIDANGAWGVDEAIARVKAYNDAARPKEADTSAPGLEYVEQPCQTLQDLAAVRAATGVRVAADESIRLAPDPFELPGLDEAADLIVVKVAPLGGVRRARAVVDAHGLPCVISSALESAVGMRAGFALAASVPTLAGACGLGTGQLFNCDVSWPIRTTDEQALGPLSPNNLDYVDKLDELEHLTAQLREILRSNGDKNTLIRRDWTDGD